VQPVSNILQDLRMNLFIIRRAGYLNVFGKRIKFFPAGNVDLFAFRQKQVIGFLAEMKLFVKPMLMLIRRINAVSIHSIVSHMVS